MDTQTKPSRLIGPEDVKRGDYVTVTHITYEYIRDNCFSQSGEELKILRATAMNPSAGRPVKVLEACLPFVLVEDARGDLDTIDLRRHRVAKVSSRFGKLAFKAMRERKQADRHWAY